MPSIKISQLPSITQINANTANTLFVGVDLPTGITGKMTATVLANGLYSNNALNVGVNPNTLPNTIAQFALSGDSYIQTNLVNTNDGGTADIVITANAGSGGTDSANFIDMGYVNKNYQPGFEYNNIGTAVSPLDGYFYVQGTQGSANSGNLVLGTTTSNTALKFIVGGGSSANIVATLTSNSLTLNTQSSLVFGDGTKQTTAAIKADYIIAAYAAANSSANVANASYTQANSLSSLVNSAYTQGNSALIFASASYAAANVAAANTVYIQNNLNIANANIAAVNTLATAAYSYANSAVQNTSTIQINNLNLSGNLIANTGVSTVSLNSMISKNATFSNNVIILGNLSANTLQGNVFFSNLTTTTIQANTIDFTAQATYAAGPTQIAGQLWYSGDVQELVLDTDVAGDRPGIGRTEYERVFNGSGTTLFAGSIVRLQGLLTPNNIPYVTFADATTAANSQVFGYVKQPIANNNYGYVYSSGLVEGANTAGYTNGDILFLNATTPGLASNVAPLDHANACIQIAKVVSANATQGKIRVQFIPQPAYGKANGSLLYANNGITVATPYFIINDPQQTFVMNATVQINNTNFLPNVSAVRIDGSNNAVAQNTTSTGTMLQVIGLDGGYATRMIIDNYSLGNANAYPIIAGRAARGNSANPTAVQSGDVLMRWGGNGYGTTFYGLAGGATIDYLAAENYTDANHGSTITVNTTTPGTNSRIQTLSVNNSTFLVSSNTLLANGIFQYNASLNNAVISQNSSKSTAVTANGRTGQITTNNSALNKGVAVQFTVNNSYIVSAKDIVILNIASGASVGYDISVNNVQPGSFQVNLHNADSTPSGSNASDNLVINFAVLRVN